MPEIKLHVSDTDLQRLNAEAAAAGIPRAHLIRERALSANGGVARLTTAEYHALVAGAAAYMRGDLPRLQVETLCAYVITQLTRRATAA
jgi:hypothetical protein